MWRFPIPWWTYVIFVIATLWYGFLALFAAASEIDAATRRLMIMAGIYLALILLTRPEEQKPGSEEAPQGHPSTETVPRELPADRVLSRRRTRAEARKRMGWPDLMLGLTVLFPLGLSLRSVWLRDWAGAVEYGILAIGMGVMWLQPIPRKNSSPHK